MTSLLNQCGSAWVDVKGDFQCLEFREDIISRRLCISKIPDTKNFDFLGVLVDPDDESKKGWRHASSRPRQKP